MLSSRVPGAPAHYLGKLVVLIPRSLACPPSLLGADAAVVATAPRLAEVRIYSTDKLWGEQLSTLRPDITIKLE